MYQNKIIKKIGQYVCKDVYDSVSYIDENIETAKISKNKKCIK